jgi:glycosyltransferase involved in cell wall biosynthesis
LRIAYFSPLNPIRSGISDYSEDLLPHLADLVDVDLFVDGFQPSNQELADRFCTYPIAEYPRRRWDYDIALYHMGNNLYHEAIYRMALRFPGVVVLHDYALVGIIGSMTAARGDRGGFVREWGYNHGLEGLARVRAILDGRMPLSPDEPLNRRLLDISIGLVVHSDYLRRRVLTTCPLADVAHIPMPCASHQPRPLTRQAARRELGLDEEGLYVGSFGFIVPSKQVEPLLDVFAELLPQFPNARLIFVGEPLEWYDPTPLIEQRGLADKVTITGYLPLSTWYTTMAAMDLAVNLRYPTLGETSAAVLRLLGEGVPTAVSNVGWYSELPGDCVVKVDVGETMRNDLYSVMAGLLGEPERRHQLGERGRAYFAVHHKVEEAARRYVAFWKQVLEGASAKCN